MGVDVNDMANQAQEQGLSSEQVKSMLESGIYQPEDDPHGDDWRSRQTELEAAIVTQTGQLKRLFSLSQGWEGYDEQFSYLIKGYLPAASFGVVYGASGSYKSFHVLAWAVHVALGLDWNGSRVNPAPVLYVAGEGGVGVRRRIKALANQYNDGQQFDNLYRIDFGVQVTKADQMGELLSLVEAKSVEIGQKFGLVIIDTLARCFGGADENQARDMGAFVSACDQIKASTGATVLVVHHSGVQDKDRARGSTSLRGACDFEYRIERAGTPKGSDPAYVLSCTKAKDDKEQPGQMFQLVERYLFTDNDGDEVCSLVALNQGQEPPAQAPDTEDGKPLTANEQTLWQAVRARKANLEPTQRKLLRDDLKAQGMNVSNFARWVSGCMDKGVLREEGGELLPVVVTDETS